MTKHQLYLNCQYCHTYFQYNGGKRSSVCSDKCKVAKWRASKMLPKLSRGGYVNAGDSKMIIDIDDGYIIPVAKAKDMGLIKDET